MPPHVRGNTRSKYSQANHQMKVLGTVLLLADRRQSQTGKALRAAGYSLITSFSSDHAVALCLNNDINVVILDSEHFVVTENWSVAQSLKMIKARICVVLLAQGKISRDHMPPGIDAMVTDGDTGLLLKTLKRLM